MCRGIHSLGTAGAVRLALSKAFQDKVKAANLREFVQLLKVTNPGEMELDLMHISWDMPLVAFSAKAIGSLSTNEVLPTEAKPKPA
jgi:hypothetical protein